MELKPWHPLILIGLALVLSASSAKGQGPKQGTEQSGNAQNPPKQHSKPTKPTPTALIRSLTVVSTAASTPESNYQRYYPKDSAELAAWVQAASAVVLILFGGLQMYLLRRSTSATENAALAARDNAMAAKDMAEANVKSAEAAKEQADIAKKTLALSQRPRLIVRNVVVK